MPANSSGTGCPGRTWAGAKEQPARKIGRTAAEMDAPGALRKLMILTMRLVVGCPNALLLFTPANRHFRDEARAAILVHAGDLAGVDTTATGWH